jgi:hypothetical protein
LRRAVGRRAQRPLVVEAVQSGSAERVARYRANETEEQRAARLEADRLAHEETRANETEEQRAARLEANRLAHREARENETEEQRAARLEADRLAHEEARENETDEQRAARLEADRLVHEAAREQEDVELQQELERRAEEHRARVADQMREAIERADFDEIASNMEECAVERIGHFQRLLRVQLNYDVYRPANITDEEHHVRQLCRMRYHVKERNESADGYESMTDLYPQLYHAFMGEVADVEQADVMQTAIEPELLDQNWLSQEPVLADQVLLHCIKGKPQHILGE